MKFAVVGCQYSDMKLRKSQLISEDFLDRLDFKLDIGNKYDKNAVACLYDGTRFGFVEKEKNVEFWKLLESKDDFEIEILEYKVYCKPENVVQWILMEIV